VRHDRDQPKHRYGAPAAAFDLPDDGPETPEIEHARIDTSSREESRHRPGDAA
jgi:hypothetical protein